MGGASPVPRGARPAAGESPERAYDACVRITRERARNFYVAFATLPRPARRAICAVYAYCRRLDDIADGNAPRAEKERALDEERERLSAALRGEAEEPVYIALADAVSRYVIPAVHLAEVLEGVREDLSTFRYRTFAELERYCYLVASSVGLACLGIFGHRGDQALKAAIDLGLAMQLTNILRDVGEDAARGRIYLPLEDLAAFDVTEGEIARGMYSDRFKRLMAFECERAKAYYASAASLFARLPRRSRPCPMVLMGVYRRLLARIEQSGFNVFTAPIGLSRAEKAATAAWHWARGLLWIPPR